MCIMSYQFLQMSSPKMRMKSKKFFTQDVAITKSALFKKLSRTFCHISTLHSSKSESLKVIWKLICWMMMMRSRSFCLCFSAHIIVVADFGLGASIARLSLPTMVTRFTHYTQSIKRNRKTASVTNFFPPIKWS